MTRNDVVTIPNPVLSKRSQRVGVINDAIHKLAENMIQATLDWEDHRKNEVGVALAAVQVGRLQRVIVIRADFQDRDNRDFKVFINPEIVKKDGGITEAPEGCLSVKDVYGLVPRYQKVKVKALNQNGKPVRITASGFLARIFQHEIDHTHGKLFIDHVKDNKFYLLNQQGELQALPQSEIKKRQLLQQ